VPGRAPTNSQVSIAIRLGDQFGNPVGGQQGTIAVSITGANAGAEVTIAGADDAGNYTARYAAANAGIDTIGIRINGAPVAGSPFVVVVSTPAVDLSVTVAASSTSLVVGDTIDVVMTVTNSGTLAATAARVVVTIPMERFTKLLLDVSHGAFTETNQTWLIGPLAPGAQAILTFRGIVRIPPSP
jgi:hypothetical protein